MKVLSVKKNTAIVEIDGSLYSVEEQNLNPIEWNENEILKQLTVHLQECGTNSFNYLGEYGDFEKTFKEQTKIQLKHAIENNKWEDLFKIAKELGENCSAQIGMYNQAKQFELAGGNAQSQYARIRMWANDILKKYS